MTGHKVGGEGGGRGVHGGEGRIAQLIDLQTAKPGTVPTPL